MVSLQIFVLFKSNLRWYDEILNMLDNFVKYKLVKDLGSHLIFIAERKRWVCSSSHLICSLISVNNFVYNHNII